MTPQLRQELLSLLADLDSPRLHDRGANTGVVLAFLKRHSLKWDDIITPSETLPNMTDQDLLDKCYGLIDYLSEWEERFISSNIEKMNRGQYEVLTDKQKVSLGKIVRKLQTLSVWEESP